MLRNWDALLGKTFNHMPIYTDLRQISIWEVINQKLKSSKNESSAEAGG